MNWEKLCTEFQNPAVEVRPLQIVHGFDGYVTAQDATVEETSAERGGQPPRSRDLSGIDRVLMLLKEGGAGGVVTNVGFGSTYLRDPQQWETLRYAMRRVKEMGLLSWLYDEEGYPSGAAGGLVLDGHPELEAMAIGCEKQLIDGPTTASITAPVSLSRFLKAVVIPVQNGIPNLAQSQDVSGKVDDQHTLTCSLPSGSWMVMYFFEKFAYEGTHAAHNVHAYRRYINVLDPEAVKRFIDVTHEAYLRELGPDLGGARAFFTDEPSLMAMYAPALPDRFEGKIPVQDPLLHDDHHPMIAWSRQFAEEFRRNKGYDIVANLQALFAGADEDSAKVRADYREVVSKLFGESYMGQISNWCIAHGVHSSGHVLAEESLLSHVDWLGADLFALMKRQSLPGVDMLNSNPESMVSGDEFMTPKQVASAAHMVGRKWVMSETCDWVQGNQGRNASIDEILGTANLQYLLGVSILTLYYDWKRMGTDYPIFTAYAGRLGTMLTAGQHDPGVAILYPLRSVWTRFIPQGEVLKVNSLPGEVKEVVSGWTDSCRWLLTHQVDFDCMDEESLYQARINQGTLTTGYETYKTVVIPPAYELAEQTIEALKRFVVDGGKVVIVGGADTTWKRELVELNPSTQLTENGVSGLEAAIGDTIQPLVHLEVPQVEVFCTRHRVQDSTLYFIINNSASPKRTTARFDETGFCRQWDPRLGNVLEMGQYQAGDKIELDLPTYAGVFFSFD